MTDLTDIGEAVKQQREKRGLTQNQLASRSGVSRALITALETGRLPELGVRKLIRILNVVGLDFRITTLNRKRPTFEDLLEEEGNSE